jgi:protein involved in polysaccharide export with SLBB domain
MRVPPITRNLIFVLAGSIGCSSSAIERVKPATSRPVRDTSLGPGDVFDVRVFAEPDLSGAYRVDSQGEIDFPLAGRIEVRGLLAGEVADVLRERLSTYVREPQVTVFVKEMNSKRITIYGQVQHPGVFPFGEAITLSQAVSLAGGFTSMAAPTKVHVTRTEGNMQRVFQVNLQAISEGKASNVFLLPGDELYVPAWMF